MGLFFLKSGMRKVISNRLVFLLLMRKNISWKKNKIGKQFMSYIRQEVHVSGTLQIKKDNTKKIIVKEFSVKNS